MAGVVTLLPQFCFSTAHASNDSAVQLTSATAFYVWIRGLRDPEFDQRLFGAGASLGLAILSKLTAVALIPGLGVLILCRIFQLRRRATSWSKCLKHGLSMIIGAIVGTLLVSGWWFVRNLFTYGEFTGTAAALRFFAARFTKADFSHPRVASDLFRYTMESLWGRFGWNDITLPYEWYHLCNTAAIFLITLSLLVGIVMFALSAIGKRPFDIVKWQASLVFFVIGSTLLAGYIQFNKQVGYMPMARYFFILLLPEALLLTGGISILAARRGFRVAVVVLFFLGLAILNTSVLITVKDAGIAAGGVRQHAASHN